MILGSWSTPKQFSAPDFSTLEWLTSENLFPPSGKKVTMCQSTYVCTYALYYIFRVTTPSVDSGHPEATPSLADADDDLDAGDPACRDEIKQLTTKIATLGSHLHEGLKYQDTLSSDSSPCRSPVSSDGGGSYPQELMDNFALNMHRWEVSWQQHCGQKVENCSFITGLTRTSSVVTATCPTSPRQTWRSSGTSSQRTCGRIWMWATCR